MVKKHTAAHLFFLETAACVPCVCVMVLPLSFLLTHPPPPPPYDLPAHDGKNNCPRGCVDRLLLLPERHNVCTILRDVSGRAPPKKIKTETRLSLFLSLSTRAILKRHKKPRPHFETAQWSMVEELRVPCRLERRAMRRTNRLASESHEQGNKKNTHTIFKSFATRIPKRAKTMFVCLSRIGTRQVVLTLTEFGALHGFGMRMVQPCR